MPHLPRPGEVLYQQSFLSIRRTCGQCNGAGEIVKEALHRVPWRRLPASGPQAEGQYPPGVDNGTRLRLTQEGQPGPNGGPAGDLYVILKVREHSIFDRRGTICTAGSPSTWPRLRWARNWKSPQWRASKA